MYHLQSKIKSQADFSTSEVEESRQKDIFNVLKNTTANLEFYVQQKYSSKLKARKFHFDDSVIKSMDPSHSKTKLARTIKTKQKTQPQLTTILMTLEIVLRAKSK